MLIQKFGVVAYPYDSSTLEPDPESKISLSKNLSQKKSKLKKTPTKTFNGDKAHGRLLAKNAQVPGLV